MALFSLDVSTPPTQSPESRWQHYQQQLAHLLSELVIIFMGVNLLENLRPIQPRTGMNFGTRKACYLGCFLFQFFFFLISTRDRTGRFRGRYKIKNLIILFTGRGSFSFKLAGEFSPPQLPNSIAVQLFYWIIQ